MITESCQFIGRRNRTENQATSTQAPRLIIEWTAQL